MLTPEERNAQRRVIENAVVTRRPTAHGELLTPERSQAFRETRAPKVVDVESRVVKPAKEPKARVHRSFSEEFGAAFKRPQRHGQKELDGDGSYPGRPPLHSGAVWALVGVEFAVLILCRVVFGLPSAVPLQFALLAALGARQGPAAGMVLGNLGIGLIVANTLFGFVLWPSSLIGAVSVLLLAFSFLSTASPTTGDANPVAYIVAIIAVRAYLATFYASITAVSSTTSFLTWLSVFVVGIVPDWPTLANVALFMILNGTLVVYLTLLLKRIANPLAN